MNTTAEFHIQLIYHFKIPLYLKKGSESIKRMGAEKEEDHEEGSKQREKGNIPSSRESRVEQTGMIYG